ncbi:hypothetical protein Pmani_038929, partial [Petrolisthes manimaculis]
MDTEGWMKVGDSPGEDWGLWLRDSEDPRWPGRRGRRTANEDFLVLDRSVKVNSEEEAGINSGSQQHTQTNRLLLKRHQYYEVRSDEVIQIYASRTRPEKTPLARKGHWNTEGHE